MTEYLASGPKDAKSLLILAHGAGAPMTSPWMEALTAHLVETGIIVVRFEFDYMAARKTGSRKPPPRADRLTGEYQAAIHAIKQHHLKKRQKLIIGGKSMGGRVASMIADELFADGAIDGLACVSYPFHRPKSPEALRTAHLEEFRCPALIVQGERDPFGTREEVTTYRLAPAIDVAWMPDGDHDLKPRVKSGRTLDNNLKAAAEAISRFCEAR